MNSKVNAAEKSDDTNQGTSIFRKFSCIQKSRVEPVNSEPVREDKNQKELKEQIKFIQEKFHQKECGRFISEPGQSGEGKSCLVKELRCHCGEVLSMHAGIGSERGGFILDKHSIIPQEYKPYFKGLDYKLSKTLPNLEWDPAYAFSNCPPTTAFGKIDFNVQQIQGRKPAKYVRISNDDKVEDVLELMKNVWCILKPEPPNLVISVVGGAKNFKLDGRSRTIFSTALIKAAKTTKAWLITSGCNIGVMRSVGQVINEGQSFHWDQNRLYHVLRCIGIAPWGYIKDRECLESDGSGKFNAQYRSSTQIEHKQPVPLNSDHTHFILVDDGYRNRYGGVNEFRSKFEKHIAQDKKEGGLGIPVVLILVEGGTDSIYDVRASLSQEIPVVVCDGTGRAADILSYAYSNMSGNGSKTRAMPPKYQENLKNKIAQAYHKEGPDLEELTKLVIDCCLRKDLVVIFNMKKHEELDLAILSVLLNGISTLCYSVSFI